MVLRYSALHGGLIKPLIQRIWWHTKLAWLDKKLTIVHSQIYKYNFKNCSNEKDLITYREVYNSDGRYIHTWLKREQYTFFPYNIGLQSSLRHTSIINDINSVGHSYTIWWQRSWLSLVLAKVRCLKATSHYLNQCWIVIKRGIAAITRGRFDSKHAVFLFFIWVWKLLM